MVYNTKAVRIGIGHESTHNEKTTSLPQYWGIFSSINRSDNTDISERDGLRNQREPQGYDVLLYRYEFNKEMRWVYSWMFLHYVFGKSEQVGESDGIYEYDLESLNESYHPSYTLELSEIDGSEKDVNRYIGTTVEDMELSWERGEQVNVSIGVVARRKERDSEEEQNTEEPSDPVYYKYSDVIVEVGDEEDNLEALDHLSGSLNLDKNLVKEANIRGEDQDKTIARPLVGKFSWSLTLTRRKVDKDFEEGINKYVKVKVRRDSDHYVEFDLGKCLINEVQNPLDRNNVSVQEELSIRPYDKVSANVKEEVLWQNHE